MRIRADNARVPACKQQAPTIGIAKSAFLMHCLNDAAWNRHYTPPELAYYVDALT